MPDASGDVGVQAVLIREALDERMTLESLLRLARRGEDDRGVRVFLPVDEDVAQLCGLAALDAPEIA